MITYKATNTRGGGALSIYTGIQICTIIVGAICCKKMGVSAICYTFFFGLLLYVIYDLCYILLEPHLALFSLLVSQSCLFPLHSAVEINKHILGDEQMWRYVEICGDEQTHICGPGLGYRIAHDGHIFN